MIRPEPSTIVTSPRGQRVLVIGLGRFGGGVGVTRWLVAQGAVVTVTDQASPDSLVESVEALRGLPVEFYLGGHRDGDLNDADLVVVNPAVDKRTSSLFQEIVRRGIPWTTEMNLFCERCPATVLGVTGTFGKSTTCAMLFEVFDAARLAGRVRFRAVHLGGNIGRSLLTELPNIDERDLVILEMSNAQLEDLPRIEWAPDVAVITNLHPHHLDRYGCFADYVRAKLNIVRDPKGRSPVITGELHPEAAAMLSAALSEPIHPIPDRNRNRRVLVEPLNPKPLLSVPGEHNKSNAACVGTVCGVMGLDEALVRGALRSFRGLPHRLEFVRTLNGVEYFNDSKSTAPSATVVALEAMTRPIVAIIGGQRKDVPLTELAMSLQGRCRAVICMGESGPFFADALRVARITAVVRTVPGLEEAVQAARALAQPGDTVLFSPGAPSFDRYDNFTERGRHFVEVVQGL